MSEKQQIWSLAMDTMQAFVPFYQEKAARAMQNAPANWFVLSLARGTEPEPLTARRLRQMQPYGAPQRPAAILEELAAEGLLQPAAAGGYCLTEAGRETAERFFYAAHDGLRAAAPLRPEEMAQLRDLLGRLLKATLQADEPAQKFALAASRWTDPGEDAVAGQIDQYITDLARFRDDAHTAAWQAHEVDGPAWEALTLVWREQADTAETIAARLAHRQLHADDYTAALEALVGCGWLERHDGVYRLTAEGRRVREAAEVETHRYFLAGWTALSEGELSQLEKLLTRARDNLQETSLRQMWPLMHSVSQAIFPVTRDVVEPAFAEHFPQRSHFLYARRTRELDPEPLTVDRLRQRNPYSNPEYTANMLAAAAGAGLLQPAGVGAYTISDTGRSAVDALNDRFYERLGEIDVLNAEQFATLVTLLERLVAASLESEAPRKRALQDSNASPLPRAYAPLARVDLALDDLNAFRDDAHLAAWQQHDVSGRDWEAFTFVWRREEKTAAALAERLSFRGYDEAAYARSLETLAKRGWIAAGADGYEVTPAGQAVREAAEAETDAIFLAPWSELSQQEQAQLRTLLIRLKLQLEQLAPA